MQLDNMQYIGINTISYDMNDKKLGLLFKILVCFRFTE